MSIPIIICGAFGRMGRAIIDLASTNNGFSIEAGVVHRKREDGVENTSFPIYDNLDEALRRSCSRPVILDFSNALCARDHLLRAENYGANFVLGTTGHDDAIMLLREPAKKIAAVFAPNTSLMANLLMALSRMASSSLKDFDASILEIHHRGKRDAPSGTAKEIEKAIKAGGYEKPVPIHSMRVGDVAGEHTAYFFNDFERLELGHRVIDRRVFAQGALVAAQFIFEKPPGLYDMMDVLNLRMVIEKYVVS